MSDAANEVYVRRLLSKGHGYPVYGPKPDNYLPQAYQDRGTSIGDVVIITNDGTIDFLFNICLPSDHPINNDRTPECFEMVELDASKDLSLMEDWHGINSSIASSSVQKKSLAAQADITAPGTSVGGGACFTFTSSSSEFAILHMQEGADRQNLRHLKKFRDQALRHAKDWYRHANDTLGREISYDSLYLVTGCDKAESWGIASYSNTSGDSDVSLNWTAAPISGGDVSYTYSWDTYCPATVRVGPDQFGRGQPGKKNQCVFIRGFKIAVREGPLARIFGSVNLASMRELNAKRFLPDKSGSFAFKQRSPSSKSSHGGSPTSGHRPPSSPASEHSEPSSDSDSIFDSDPIPSEDDSDDTDDDEPSVDYFPESSELYHPLTVINNHLLRAFPEIDIAITHDDDWCLVIDKNAEFPNDEELLHQIARGHRAVVDDEGVFLLSPMNNETLSLYPTMNSFTLFPTSEDEHISSDSKIAETQHSLGGSTRTDYSNDLRQSITSETKMASDLPIIDASAVVDVPRTPQSASNPSTSSQPSHRAHSKSSMSSDNITRVADIETRDVTGYGKQRGEEAALGEIPTWSPSSTSRNNMSPSTDSMQDQEGSFSCGSSSRTSSSRSTPPSSHTSILVDIEAKDTTAIGEIPILSPSSPTVDICGEASTAALGEIASLTVNEAPTATPDVLDHLSKGAQCAADVKALVQSAQESFRLIENWYEGKSASRHPRVIAVEGDVNGAYKTYLKGIEASVQVAEHGIAFAADIVTLFESLSQDPSDDVGLFIDEMEKIVGRAHRDAKNTYERFSAARRKLNEIIKRISPRVTQSNAQDPIVLSGGSSAQSTQTRTIDKHGQGDKTGPNFALELLNKVADDVRRVLDSVNKFADWWNDAESLIKTCKNRFVSVNSHQMSPQRINAVWKEWAVVRENYEIYKKGVGVLRDDYPVERISPPLITRMFKKYWNK